MKILVSASQEGLDSPIDPRFGRAPYYVIVVPQTMEYEVIRNPNADAPHGAGIAAANLAREKGVDVVITGKVGPNAEAVLRESGIDIVLVSGGTVRKVVEEFKNSGLGKGNPSNPGGYNMWWPGWRGWGRGWGWGPPPPPYPYPDPRTEIEVLKTYRDMLKRQLEEIERRIKELENNL